MTTKKIKKQKLKERLDQIEEIVNGTDELPVEEKAFLSTTISTVYGLHLRETNKAG